MRFGAAVVATIFAVTGLTCSSADAVAPGFTSLTPARLLDTRPGATTTDNRYAGIGPSGPDTTLTVAITGRAGIPATGVGAVVINVTAANPTTGGYVTAYPTGQPRPQASNLNFTAGQTIPNLVIAKLGTNGQINLYNAAGTTDLIIDVLGWFGSLGSGFTSLTPARLLDTRPGATTTDNRYAGIGPSGPGTTLTVAITGRAGIPTLGVGAVVINVTAANPTTGGYVTAYPTGQPRPQASNLNFSAGQTIPNLVIAKLGTNGQINLYNAAGTTDLIIDVLGWFGSLGSDFTSLAPARLLDTRPGATTTDNRYAGIGPTGPDTTLTVAITGRAGIPATGVGAVVINVTAASPTTGGYVTAYPTGQPRPQASNLNFTAGQTIPNLVIAKLGTNGQINLYNAAGTTDLIIDVLGWFSDTFVVPGPPPPPPPPPV